jgi:hypothetical protein
LRREFGKIVSIDAPKRKADAKKGRSGTRPRVIADPGPSHPGFTG